jgi:hypothetical protein
MFARVARGNPQRVTVVLAIVIGLFVVISLVLFPFVGLAMLPVVVLAVLAGVAWLVIMGRRGPAALPEHPAPGEEGASAPPASDVRRETRAGPTG